MYINGCENVPDSGTVDNKRYRENYMHIFGNRSDVGTSKFPSGKGVFDDKTGTWIDSKEYKADNPVKSKPFLIGGKRETNVTLVKPNGSVKKGNFTGYKKDKVLKMEYH